jgi:cytochrome c-type biogenesis protein CcmH/NrfF
MGEMVFIMLVWAPPIAVVVVALLALWRIMKAQEEIARRLQAIERKMGGGA